MNGVVSGALRDWRQDAAVTGTLEACLHVEAGVLPASERSILLRLIHPDLIHDTRVLDPVVVRKKKCLAQNDR